MSPSSGIIFRSKLSASFTNSSIATYRTTATRYASRFRGAPKTHSQGPLTTVSNTTQDDKQCEHTAPKLLDQTTPVPADRNPFIFSRGHWLSHDSARQAARRIRFDFSELCKRVVACCTGAKSVVSWSKQDNLIYRTLVFHTDSGKCVVVRLPTPAAGLAGRVVNSEVATIRYLTSKTDIPVPSILEWTEDNDNTVGHPYLMMEHATGVSLHDIWSKLRGDWKKKCVKAICRQLTKTTQLCFPAYGSLYLSDTSSVPSSCKIQIGNNFCIEPQCGPIEQDLYAREPFIPGSGPWTSMPEFANGVVRLGMEGVANRHRFSVPDRPYQGTPEQHVDLLNHAHRVLMSVVEDPRVHPDSIHTMLHANPTMRNVFVDPRDPRIVTCITGWQACTISPAFSYRHVGRLRIPPFDAGEDVNDTFPQQGEISSIRKSWLYSLFLNCHNTWYQGLPGLEKCLIECAQNWHYFHLPGLCPYEPPTFELADERYRRWSNDRSIKSEVCHLLGNVKDDFVENDAWSDMPEKLKKARISLYKSACEAGEPCEEYGLVFHGDTRETIDASWPYSDFD
ncbi:hypothetical protein KCU92_g2881, partial [Aureobasidium melanogenum]